MLRGGGVARVLPDGHQRPNVLQHPSVQKSPPEYLEVTKTSKAKVWVVEWSGVLRGGRRDKLHRSGREGGIHLWSIDKE